MWDPYSDFEKVTLSNGLTIYVANWPGRPWEQVGFLIHSGAEQDPVGREGVAHFVEHVVSENVELSRKDLENFFKDSGGKVRLGGTGDFHTDYSFFIPTTTEIVNKAFSLFGEMLFTAKLEKKIERERKVIIGEFNRKFSSALEIELETRESKAIFSGCWLENSFSALGLPETINSISQKDLQGFYDKHYTPANMSIVCVGGLNIEQVVEAIQQSPFGMDKPGKRVPLPTSFLDFPLPKETRYLHDHSKYSKKGNERNSCGYYSIARVPNNVGTVAPYLLKMILYRILFDELREKRAWTYAVKVSLLNMRHFSQVSISCNSFEVEALDDIEAVIEECILSVASMDNFFERLKNQNLVNVTQFDLTGEQLCKRVFDQLIFHDRIIKSSEIMSEMKAVTMGEVVSLLKWLKPERRWTMISRP